MNVMEAAKDRHRSNRAIHLDGTMDRTILAQCPMRPGPIVTGGVISQDSAQVRLSYDHEVVKAVAPDRADQPLHIAVLPRQRGAIG